MSPDFQKFKEYYDTNRWGKARLSNAVVKHRITEEEYKLITGEEYRPPNYE